MRINLKKMNEELEYLQHWRLGFFHDDFPIKKAKRILISSKKKGLRFCSKYGKIMYLCRECKGSGFKVFRGEGEYFRFSSCRRCNSLGVVDWLSNVIGGTKRV